MAAPRQLRAPQSGQTFWSRLTADEDRCFYAELGGPFGPCDGCNNALLWAQNLDVDGREVGDRVLLAGGGAGFSDSTFDDPRGRFCQTGANIAYANNRVYLNDVENDAIRYVSVNIPAD